ncbi:MAG: GNAT family N-acetyltransferase [Gemmatimonadales bacterium]|nr:GNAT family N-acetyltransferase [Gemmatimonadales bacterium]
MSEIAPQFLAGLLPDLPRWVEVRSMLLAGRATTLGVSTTGSPSFVALEPDGSLAVVVGQPPDDAILAAASRSRELLVTPEGAEWIADALPGWRREAATLHLLGSDARLTPEIPETVRELDPEELVAVPEPALREELLAASEEGTRITGAFHGAAPVAFCYAGSVTERWWDISIDTLETHRRQGYAARCVALCIRRMARLGKQPVWAAVESNVASSGLAAKLDFRPADTLFLFSR